MPPKRNESRSGSTTASSSSTSGSSSSSSSGSSSSDSDSSSESDSSASQRSTKNKARNSSGVSSSTESGKESPQKNQKAVKLPLAGQGFVNRNLDLKNVIFDPVAKKHEIITRSRSASSVSSSGSEDSPKKSDKKPKKSHNKAAVASRAVPKKSATAKPVAKAATFTKKQLSDNDSDSDFGDYSLPNLTAKAKAKKAASDAAALASSSPASQPSPSTKSLLSGTPVLQPSKLAASVSKPEGNTPGATSTPAVSTDKSRMKSIFSESSMSSDSEANERPTTKSSGKQVKKKVGSQQTSANITSRRRSPSPPKQAASKKTPSPSKTPGKRGRPLGSGGKKNTSLAAAAVAGLAARATASAAKLQARKKNAPKRGSSVSSVSLSNSAPSSNSSSSDSSDNSSDEKEQTPKKVSQKKSSGAPRGRPKTQKELQPTEIETKKAHHSTDSESGKVVRPVTRKTRGAMPRKSRHVTGKHVSESDTDGEVNTSTKISSQNTPQGGQKKRTTVLFPPVRKEIDGVPPMEKRNCPMVGCDSSGHLGGRLDRHFLLESCPVFHNLTKKTCRDFHSEIVKRSSQRKKALTAIATKSPLASPTNDQKKHTKLVQEARARFREENVPTTEDLPDDCEPDLIGFTSEWDLQIFREAQADASEIIEDTMRGLPDTRQTRYIEMGSCEMEVWYQSPYPDDFSSLPKIYICEFCLKYHRSAIQLKRHAAKCVWSHPPGDEIYRKEPISVFEICGKRYKQYCQSLCLLAKFFLDHKTLYFDVEPFLFYVMTTADSAGCHIVGYFSKEKNSLNNYNVSCILTLPPFQRQGYGRLLIDFSYLLSRAEGKTGSPEKPLSDLGLITYRAYWKEVLLEYICNYPEKEISIKAFSEEMGINPNDIISTLQYMGMIKYWKGQHLILKREDLISDYKEKSRNRPKGREIYPNALKWKPYQPSAKERKHAEQIKRNQEKQKRR